MPQSFGTYFEPFLGAGALFFLLQPMRAVLGDACGPLIDTYMAVRDDHNAILRYLRPLRPSRSRYYKIRANPSNGRIKRAAEFLYLNRTCWNGLYRVNSNGIFNVPYGRPKTETLMDAHNLRACASALRRPNVRLRKGDFEQNLRDVKANDFVYLDPPYVTRHNSNGFIDYNEKLFSWKDQERLAGIAALCVRSGARVIVTNAFHPEVLRLYPGFDVYPIVRTSTLANDVNKRGRVREAVLASRPTGTRTARRERLATGTSASHA